MDALTSKEWLIEFKEKYDIRILSHEGWNRENFDYSFNRELINKGEFLSRLYNSTMRCDPTMLQECIALLGNTIRPLNPSSSLRYRDRERRDGIARERQQRGGGGEYLNPGTGMSSNNNRRDGTGTVNGGSTRIPR